jgi:hypothetical protein
LRFAAGGPHQPSVNRLSFGVPTYPATVSSQHWPAFAWMASCYSLMAEKRASLPGGATSPNHDYSGMHSRRQAQSGPLPLPMKRTRAGSAPTMEPRSVRVRGTRSQDRRLQAASRLQGRRLSGADSCGTTTAARPSPKGGLTMPFSVTIAVTRRWGVTSKAGLRARAPPGATGSPRN